MIPVTNCEIWQLPYEGEGNVPNNNLSLKMMSCTYVYLYSDLHVILICLDFILF